MIRRAVFLAALVLGQAALAEAPAVSARPLPRPVGRAVAPTVTVHAPVASRRPLPRPGQSYAGAAPDPADIAAAVTAATVTPPVDPVTALIQSVLGARPSAAAAPVSGSAVARSVRPERRPSGFARLVAAVAAPRAASRAGSVCGVAEIKGAALAPITGPGRCGIAAPVRVTSVSGVRLSMQPTIDCPTAKALNSWVRDGVIPTVGRSGGGAAGLRIIAHYACRTRNNVPGARLSEHAFGHAVDVAAVVLRDGTEISVENDWKSGKYRKIIRALHAKACGPFGTVLGPNADANHYNHFHLDTAHYRGGPYCR